MRSGVKTILKRLRSIGKIDILQGGENEQKSVLYRRLRTAPDEVRMVQRGVYLGDWRARGMSGVSKLGDKQITQVL